MRRAIQHQLTSSQLQRYATSDAYKLVVAQVCDERCGTGCILFGRAGRKVAVGVLGYGGTMMWHAVIFVYGNLQMTRTNIAIRTHIARDNSY